MDACDLHQSSQLGWNSIYFLFYIISPPLVPPKLKQLARHTVVHGVKQHVCPFPLTRDYATHSWMWSPLKHQVRLTTAAPHGLLLLSPHAPEGETPKRGCLRTSRMTHMVVIAGESYGRVMRSSSQLLQTTCRPDGLIEGHASLCCRDAACTNLFHWSLFQTMQLSLFVPRNVVWCN